MKQVYGTGFNGFIGRNLKERLDDFVAIPHKKITKTKLKPYDKFFFLSTY